MRGLTLANIIRTIFVEQSWRELSQEDLYSFLASQSSQPDRQFHQITTDIYILTAIFTVHLLIASNPSSLLMYAIAITYIIFLYQERKNRAF